MVFNILGVQGLIGAVYSGILGFVRSGFWALRTLVFYVRVVTPIDFVKSFPQSVWLRNLASIEPIRYPRHTPRQAVFLPFFRERVL